MAWPLILPARLFCMHYVMKRISSSKSSVEVIRPVIYVALYISLIQIYTFSRMGKLDELWSKTGEITRKWSSDLPLFQSNFPISVFDESDVGEKYCEMIIREGTSAPLLDLPDDAPLPSYFDRNLFKKYSMNCHLSWGSFSLTDLFRRAQDYYQKYTVFISTTNVLGVMILFGVESILDILVCTQQSSTPVTAFKRYTETLLYIDNIFADSPEDPLSKYAIVYTCDTNT